MRILHISDTHGPPPVPEGDWDVVVHSGDLMPNRTYGTRPIEIAFQRRWLEENVPKLHPRYRLKPFVYCPGNHDYADPVPVLREFGIDAHHLRDDLLTLEGVTFWGHPWTPIFYEWNWMCGPLEMRHHLSPVVELLNQGTLDVLVTHGPAYAILDVNQDGEHCGCKVLRDVLEAARHPPKLHLHGHIHESPGLVDVRGVAVSNAARTQRILEV